MKPLNVFPRRVLSLSLSVYFTVFSSLSLAAPAASKDKKPASKTKQVASKTKSANQASIKTKSGAKKNEFPLIDKNSAIYKNYLHALKLAGPDENLFPEEVTKSSKDDQKMNSFIRYAAPFSLPSDPFSMPPSIPSIPSLPPMTPLPPITPGIPSGGRMFPGNDFPNLGDVFNTTQNMMNTAPVSAEFSCPFFESNPHEAIFRALKSMRDSLSTINNECLKTGEADQIYSNSDRIKNAVLYLKHFQTNPEQISTLNTKDIENSVSSAMEGINQITTRLKSNAILKPECGGFTSSMNRTIIAFNDVINNLAPVALITTALIPQISTTARAAIFGTTVVSQFVSSFWDSFKNNSIDMTRPENSRAVLQNTCQYLRVAQKINFLTYVDKGKASDLSKNLDNKIKKFQTRFSDPSNPAKSSDPLNPGSQPIIPMLKYRYNSEKMFAEIETSLTIARADYRQYKYTIDKYRSDMKNDGIDRNEEICGVGARLASVGSIADNSSLLGMGGLGGFGGGFGGFGPMNSLVAFPLSIIANLDRVTEALQQANSNGFPGGFPGGFGFPVAPPPPIVPPAEPANPPAEKPAENTTVGENQPIPDPFPLPDIPPPATNDQAIDQAENYFQEFKEYRNKVVASNEKVKQGNVEAIKYCADSTFKWFEKINILLDYTANLANAERTGVAQELEKNPEYKEWALQYQKLKSEKQTISPLIQVLNAMSSENAQTTRTEMQSGLIQLKNTLFKRNTGLSESPVESWLSYNLRMHENMLGDFTKKYVSLRDGAFDLTETAKKTFLRRLNAQADRDIKNSQSLANLNLKNIKTDSLVHYKACERINTALLSYNAAKDFLNSSQFMCNMIFGIMSDTGPQIVKICQGSLNITQNKSEIEIRKEKLSRKNAGMKIDSHVENYSFNQMEDFLKKAGQELKCPDPTSPLIL